MKSSVHGGESEAACQTKVNNVKCCRKPHNKAAYEWLEVTTQAGLLTLLS